MAGSTEDGVCVIIISQDCVLSSFSCLIYKQQHSFQLPHMRSYARGQCFVLRCSHFWRLLHLKGYISCLLSLCITLNHTFCSVWQTTWNVCRLCVFPCVRSIHRGQAEKEGRGHCLSRGGGVE